MKRTILAAAVLFGLVSGCATSSQNARATATRPQQASNSGDAPYLVSVTLPDLRPPSDIRSDCSTYVAWIRTEDGAVRRAGEIAYDERTRSGRIDVLSSTDRFTLLVTAEPTSSVSEPSLNALVVRQPAGTATASAARTQL